MTVVIDVLDGLRFGDVPDNGLVVDGARDHELGVVGPRQIVDVREVPAKGDLPAGVCACVGMRVCVWVCACLYACVYVYVYAYLCMRVCV